MPKQKDKVIIDTNLWISFLLTKDLSSLDTIIADRKATLVFSEELLDELIEVTQRKKFKKYFDLEDVKDLLLKIRSRAVFVPVQSEVEACSDPKDNFLLSLAVDSNATHLVTGDKDLLSIGSFRKTKILTVKEYLAAK